MGQLGRHHLLLGLLRHAPADGMGAFIILSNWIRGSLQSILQNNLAGQSGARLSKQVLLSTDQQFCS